MQLQLSTFGLRKLSCLRACRSVVAFSPRSRPELFGWPAASVDHGCGVPPMGSGAPTDGGRIFTCLTSSLRLVQSFGHHPLSKSQGSDMARDLGQLAPIMPNSSRRVAGELTPLRTWRAGTSR